MAEAAKLTPIPVDTELDIDVDISDYCSRPLCRQEFRQVVGRGRRRDYCSETCRRLADRDYKRARALVEHFERLARRQRYDVLAFGRTSDEVEPDQAVPAEVALERASAAVGRADAVLRFAGTGDSPMADELRFLCEAIRPLIARVRAS